MSELFFSSWLLLLLLFSLSSLSRHSRWSIDLCFSIHEKKKKKYIGCRCRLKRAEKTMKNSVNTIGRGWTMERDDSRVPIDILLEFKCSRRFRSRTRLVFQAFSLPKRAMERALNESYAITWLTDWDHERDTSASIRRFFYIFHFFLQNVCSIVIATTHKACVVLCWDAWKKSLHAQHSSDET